MIMNEARDLLLAFREAEKRCCRLDESSLHWQVIVWRGREYDVSWRLRFNYPHGHFEPDVSVLAVAGEEEPELPPGYLAGEEESELLTLIEGHLSKLGGYAEWPTKLPVGWLSDGRRDVHEDEV